MILKEKCDQKMIFCEETVRNLNKFRHVFPHPEREKAALAAVIFSGFDADGTEKFSPQLRVGVFFTIGNVQAEKLLRGEPGKIKVFVPRMYGCCAPGVVDNDPVFRGHPVGEVRRSERQHIGFRRDVADQHIAGKTGKPDEFPVAVRFVFHPPVQFEKLSLPGLPEASAEPWIRRQSHTGETGR